MYPDMYNDFKIEFGTCFHFCNLVLFTSQILTFWRDCGVGGWRENLYIVYMLCGS